MRSLSTRLTLAFVFIGVLGAVLVAVLTAQRTRRAFDQFLLDRDQEQLVAVLINYYGRTKSWDGVAALFNASGDGLLAGQPGFNPRFDHEAFTLVGPDNRVVYGSTQSSIGKQISASDMSHYVELMVNGKTAGYLLLPASSRLQPANTAELLFLRNVTRASLISALVAALLAVLLGGLLAFTLTRSLRELTAATQELSQGRLGAQVKVRSNDELGELATSFNQMSTDLASATKVRRQMTADIAHDLRTPLSVLSGYAEALSDGKLEGTPEVYTVLHQESLRLNRLVEDLRTLSLADAGELSLYKQSVASEHMLEWAAARHTVAAREKGINLRLEPTPALPSVMVDAERMAQVLDNLVVNAFRYTPAGGEVALSGFAASGSVHLTVRDTGSGIAPADLPHIFDRFYRADPARSASGESGLGLAIARSIVEAHGGTIAVASQPGQGSTFTITLPAV